jgi:hypothetical protein
MITEWLALANSSLVPVPSFFRFCEFKNAHTTKYTNDEWLALANSKLVQSLFRFCEFKNSNMCYSTAHFDSKQILYFNSQIQMLAKRKFKSLSVLF